MIVKERYEIVNHKNGGVLAMLTWFVVNLHISRKKK